MEKLIPISYTILCIVSGFAISLTSPWLGTEMVDFISEVLPQSGFFSFNESVPFYWIAYVASIPAVFLIGLLLIILGFIWLSEYREWKKLKQ